MHRYYFSANGANNGLTNGVDDLVTLLGLQNQIIGVQILDSGGWAIYLESMDATRV
jgi:hypothetical protein